jgi:5-methyltetrahydrofolate--homocysteine methyltransferase
LSEPRKTVLDELFDAVVLGDVQKARKLAERAVNKGVSASVVLEKMMDAMRAVDSKYMRKEYFTVDVAAASTAMREAFKVLEPHLKVKPANMMGKVVIGSLKGNIQGLGKDIVAAALRSAGFQVVDLGVNVSPETFVTTAEREKAQVIALSISVDESVPFLKDVVNIINKKKLSGKIKTVIGGRAVSEETCKEYGIDAYARDAWDCVKKVQELLSH